MKRAEIVIAKHGYEMSRSGHPSWMPDPVRTAWFHIRERLRHDRRLSRRHVRFLEDHPPLRGTE